MRGVEGFVAAVALVFGILAWLQLPAVCGFMLSSTLAGAGNYVYSLWLGVMLAVIGIAAAFGSLVRGARHPLLIAGLVASVAFLVCAAFLHPAYAQACRDIYTFFTPG